MKTVLTMIAALIVTVSAPAQQAKGILNAYLKVKADLVQSDNKMASTHTAELQKSIEATPAFSEKDVLLKSVQKMAKSTDIEKQRMALAEISPVLWKVVKADKNSGEAYYQYCPMKKTYWVSNEPAIKNPYYGKQMLTCGKTVETIK